MPCDVDEVEASGPVAKPPFKPHPGIPDYGLESVNRKSPFLDCHLKVWTLTIIAVLNRASFVCLYHWLTPCLKRRVVMRVYCRFITQAID